MARFSIVLGLLLAAAGGEGHRIVAPPKCSSLSRFWGVRGGGAASEPKDPPTAATQPPPGYVCDGDVCYPKSAMPGVKGGAAEQGGSDKAPFTNRPHQDYFTTQVEKLVQRGHSRGDAEAAFKEAKYDLEGAASLLAGGFKTGAAQQQQAQPPPAAAAPPATAPPAAAAAAPQPPAAAPPAPVKPSEGASSPAAAPKVESSSSSWPEESVKALEGKGLDASTAKDVLDMTKGDLKAALDIVAQSQFASDLEAAVEVMVAEGWDEEVARQALLAQREKMLERGEDVALPVARPAPAPAPAPAKKAAPAPAPKKQEAPAVKPANKADVVFEVTEADLQKLVIESPVPVLLDVYADWCGPCKQLTPALEEMAVRSGGMFRLAKLNSDKNRGVVEMLQVEGLPTVFGIRDGQVVDRFVGMPQQAALQSFMMQLLGGMPRPEPDPLKADKYTLTNSELKAFSNKLAHLAGLAAFGSRKKEALENKVEALIKDTLEVGGEDEEAAVNALRTVSKYLSNTVKNPQEKKFRSIDPSKPGFQAALGPYPPAAEILRRVGFKEEEEGGLLVLAHRNQAPLIAADTVISRFLSRRSTGRGSSAVFRARSMRRPAPTPAAAPAAPAATKPAAKPQQQAPAAPAKRTAPAAAASSSYRLTLKLPSGASLPVQLSSGEQPLAKAFEALRQSKEHGPLVAEAKVVKLVARDPEVRSFVEGSGDSQRTVADLKLSRDAVLRVVLEGLPAKESPAKPKKAAAAVGGESEAKKKKGGSARRGGVHTLYSEGHLDEERGKGNRYYGGGSTYFEADVGDDEDEEKKEVKEEEDKVVAKQEEKEDDEDEGDEDEKEEAGQAEEAEDDDDDEEEDEEEAEKEEDEEEGEEEDEEEDDDKGGKEDEEGDSEEGEEEEEEDEEDEEEDEGGDDDDDDEDEEEGDDDDDEE